MRSSASIASAFTSLLAAALPAADLAISEFMASNASTLVDEDGRYSDWIEIHNAGLDAVDLAGWSLTDDSRDPKRWTFPSVKLEAGGYLVVFASGKDRRDPAGALHTNFLLDADGGYLALVRPDGSAAQTLAPYPRQVPDVSFGTAEKLDVRSLLPSEPSARVRIPADGSLGTTWTGGNEPVDDSGWIAGPLPAGYVKPAIGFAVSAYYANVPVSGLTVAESVIANPSLRAAQYAENAATIDYLGTSATGHYGTNRPFPGTVAGVDEDNFVIEARATVTIPLAGAWTFGVMSDDGFGLDLTGPGGPFRVAYPDPRGPSDSFGTFNIPAPGDYDLRLVFYEQGGGSGVELFAARGTFTSFGGSFRLVGDTAAGGLAARSDLVSGAPIRDLIRTDLRQAMAGINATAYLRIPFTVDDPSVFASLDLRVRYEDGFAAYLNGTEVARRNAPGSLAWNSRAASDRPGRLAVTVEDIPISDRLPLLRAGRNVLAFQALNDTPASPDFLIDADLVEVLSTSTVAVYFRHATPGLPNGDGYAGVVADTKFDRDRGFYRDPFLVSLTTETPDASIYFTRDGTVPGPTNGELYTGPIPIDGITVLRAAAYRDGWLPTDVDTQTYLFLEEIIRQDYRATLDAGFPASWGGTAPDYGLDLSVAGPDGQDRYGGKYAATIRDDLLAVPTISLVMMTDDLFGPNGIYTNSEARGQAWERPVSAELIRQDGQPGFHIDAGLRIQGGAFRSHGLTKKHSFRLVFRGTYGSARLEYPLFPERGAATSFDTLILRANANDGYAWDAAGGRALYIRDSFARAVALDAGAAASHEIFAHLYLNGIYWGLYDVVERPDAAFDANYFGGEKEEWDAIHDSEPQDGDPTAWNALLSRSAAGLATDEAYQAIQGRRPDGTIDPSLPDYLDAANLADYMIINIYVGNGDWPSHNWYVGRRRADSTGFKFFLWDVETALGLSDVSADRTGVTDGVAAPYAAARANEEFRMLFADRAQRFFFDGGALYVDPAQPAWDPGHPERNRPAALFAALAAGVRSAMVAESARWGDQHAAASYTRDENWDAEVANMLSNYLPRRSAIVLDQLRAAGLYPPVSAPVLVPHGGLVPAGSALHLFATDGVIYYTLDGSDPRLPGGELSPSAIEGGSAETFTMVADGADLRALVPADGALGLAWTDWDFDDRGWTAGKSGAGYERSSGYEMLIGTDLNVAMYGRSATAYLRFPFDVADPSAIGSLVLRMKYDDGFVAYLNGRRVAARNEPAVPLWNSAASANRDDGLAVIFESIDLTSEIGALRAGKNVLAIHGLNVSTTSSDFLILPELQGARITGGAWTIDHTGPVKARVLSGTTWSALDEALFVVEGDLRLRVTEVNYHPAAPPAGSPFDRDDFEFIEVRNVGDRAADLRGARIDGGVHFEFSTVDPPSLGPGEYLVVARSVQAFASRYGTIPARVVGDYDGRLSNGGDAIAIVGLLDETVLGFSYADDWYPETDGAGRTLVIRDDGAAPDSWSDRASWRASTDPGGSPGTADPPPVAGGGQVPGDADGDARLDLTDVIRLLFVLFVDGGIALPCPGGLEGPEGNRRLLDIDGGGEVDLTDVIFLLSYLFLDGPPPALGVACRPIPDCPDACAP